jgi:hypothetical protein
MLLLIDLVLFTVAALTTWYLLARVRAERRLAGARAQVALATAGIEASGNLLGASEARSRDGVTVAISNDASHTRPGDSKPTGDLCVARVRVPLVDQIVCKADEADAVMGPLPAAPRVRTGHAPFDDAYAVFIGTSGGRAAGSYRASLVEGDTPWAQAPVLVGFLELDLRWMRVHEGEADLVFPGLAIEDVVRAVALAHAVERAAEGRPVPAVARGPRLARSDVRPGVGAAWSGGAFIALVAGHWLAFTPPVQALGSDFACGPGSRITTIGSKHIGLKCEPSQGDNSLGLYHLASGLLAMLLVVLAVLGLVGSPWVRRTEPRSHR